MLTLVSAAAQYLEIKNSLPAGTIVLMRLGDFYEMYNEDAKLAANLLGLTLTRRQETPMAGFGVHTLDSYLQKLLSAGKTVAVLERTRPAKRGSSYQETVLRILCPSR